MSLQALSLWLEGTAVARFMVWSWWAWPLAECLHFVGLALLIGTVGLFDLRLLGFAKELPPVLLHRLVACGLAGFTLSAFTGVLFLSSIPAQYLGNPAFWAKAILLVIAGINVALFHLAVGTEVWTLGPGDDAPPLARALAAISLGLWFAILFAGRLIAFYKP